MNEGSFSEGILHGKLDEGSLSPSPAGVAPLRKGSSYSDVDDSEDQWEGDDLDSKLSTSKDNEIFFNSTKATYIGRVTHNRMEGVGKYKFENGNVYEGEFNDGMFHGIGVIYFPSGSYYKGEWVRGVCKNGVYHYKDELEFEEKNWQYCTESDRRFYHEVVAEKKGKFVDEVEGTMKLSHGIKPINTEGSKKETQKEEENK